jgi:hypothetical protein
MTTLKKYSELGHVWRNEPCQEYPGEWLVFSQPDSVSEGDQEVRSFPSFNEAMVYARTRVDAYDSKEQSWPIDISICWKCSDNDPRHGQVWFTGFYQHGEFNLFGEYKS